MRVKMASKVKKTYEDLSGGNTKMAKVAQKTFRASLGKFGKNPSHPTHLPAPTRMMKRHLRLVATLLKGQKGNGLAMPPFSSVPMHIILHALSLLAVVGYNVPLQ